MENRANEPSQSPTLAHEVALTGPGHLLLIAILDQLLMGSRFILGSAELSIQIESLLPSGADGNIRPIKESTRHAPVCGAVVWFSLVCVKQKLVDGHLMAAALFFQQFGCVEQAFGS